MINKIKAEIERRIEEYNIQSRAGAELADLLSFIESLEKEQPQGLDEAAEEYKQRENDLGGLYDNEGNIYESAINEAFKSGAKWMAEQGWSRELEVKEDAGGYPYIDKHIELYDYDTDAPLAKKGDKVIVQIRKK